MKNIKALLLLALSTIFAASVSAANFEVTITNLMKSTVLTPVMITVHRESVYFYQLGAPASDALSRVAEGGDTSGIAAMFSESDQVASTGGLLGAGESATVMFDGLNSHSKISIAAMLLPTNDAFIAAQSVPVKRGLGNQTFYLKAYDAGTETNDESCASIPGPQCGGEPFSPNDTGEGFVYVHSGIHGIGDLNASEYTWMNPVVKVTINRVK